MKPLTISEAAALLGVHPATIWRCVQYGTLKAFKVGRVYRIEQPDFDSFRKRLEYRPASTTTRAPIGSRMALIDQVKAH